MPLPAMQTLAAACRSLKHLFACCLLLAGFVLPLPAHAFSMTCWADTDADGFGYGSTYNFIVCLTGDVAYNLNKRDNCPAIANANQLDADGDGVGDVCDNASYDNDGDGLDNLADNCPNNSNANQLNTDGDSLGNSCDTDDDNDGVVDYSDACPLDRLASSGNNDQDTLCDVNDLDDDNDSVLDSSDNCPFSANLDQLDSDSDTQGNACDTDDDNDGVLDATDQCPLDPACTIDADSDGIDNAIDTDDDNDGLLDVNDNCPINSNADQLNTDGDAQGDACDTDEDNDGVADISDNFPLNAAASSDTDNDGVPGSWNAACDVNCQNTSGLVLDNCPSNANADQLNTDGDTQGDACDADDDNDGVVDGSDQCPLDPMCSADTDSDGIDNAIDADDDNDGALDINDNCPVFASADQTNTDGDAQGNVCDTDDDNDGVADTVDKFPLNAAASSDTDNDGVPGSWNAACDVNCQNTSGLVLDNCPSTSNVDQLNTDGDAQGNVCDTDDDNDGFVDGSDLCPLDPTCTIDTDGDGIDNFVDTDDDNDGLQDIDDNCSIISNADQLNADDDTQGNACDTDDDNDGVVDSGDNCPLDANADQYDDDYDGKGNPCDALEAAGSRDLTFNRSIHANGAVNALALQPDDDILIGGAFTTVNDTTRNRVARLHTDGLLDTGFDLGSGVSSDILAMALQGDGKVLIGGIFTTVGSFTRNRIARLNADGSLDASFNPGTGASGDVSTVALQNDGKVLIGGNFTTVNGVTRNRIARLNANGSLDTSFNAGTGANGAVNTLVLQADGKVLIGGAFTTVGGVSRNRIARLNTNGSLDTSFNPGTGAGGAILAVALQRDGKVLMGGAFTTVNGVAINRIARLNTDGSLDASFNSGTGANSTVRVIALQADGKVLIGGYFNNINGVLRFRLARLNTDGSLDTEFDSGTWFSLVYAIVLQPDGKALIVINSESTSVSRIHTGDADQDGIEDGADYFSNNAAAAFDTDRDGLPDAWLQPNIFGCVANASICNGLTLDNDNDNDGAPDYLDPEPLNSANSSVWPLNNNYQGSAMRESQVVQ